MASRAKKRASKRKRVPGAAPPLAKPSSEDNALFEAAMRGEALPQEAGPGAEEAGGATATSDEVSSTPAGKKGRHEKLAGDGFFSPFAGLGEDWAQLKEQVARAEEEAAERERQQQEAREAQEAQQAAERVAPDELELFQQAVAGAAPLPEVSMVGAERRQARARPAYDDDAEVMAELADLVAGRSEFDTLFSSEHIEGIGEGIDRRLLKKLRKGAFSVGAHLDLHGLTRLEAKPRVEAFLTESRRNHHRCVLIVHGRGLHSKDGIPVLKEAVGSWLIRGRIARSVLAFCSARATDGGLGAIYVLLRR